MEFKINTQKKTIEIIGTSVTVEELAQIKNTIPEMYWEYEVLLVSTPLPTIRNAEPDSSPFKRNPYGNDIITHYSNSSQ